jgi:DNA primase
MEAALPCMEDGRQARFLFLPEGEDPDTMVRSGGAGQFQALVANAMPLEQFLFESVAHGLDTGSMDGKARLSKLALPLLRQLPEGVYRQLMFQALAQRTGLDLASLMQLEPGPPPPAPQYHPGEPPDFPPDPGERDEQTRQRPRRREAYRDRAAGYSNMAQAAIALLLHQPVIASLVDPAPLAELEGEDVGLLRELLALLQRRPESNTAMLLGHWYGTPEGELLSRLAGQERLIPSEGIEQQFIDTMAVLARAPHHSKLAAQVDKLKHTNYAEVSELEKQRLRELLQEKQRRDAEGHKPR